MLIHPRAPTVLKKRDWASPIVGRTLLTPNHVRRVARGIRGKSCFAAFMEDKQDGTYGCRYERCNRFLASSLNDAARHQQCHHFDHRPFMCIPASVRP